MTYLLHSDAQLARVLGVCRGAVQKAELTGKIERRKDGRWDVMDVVRCWRANTSPLLQRPGRAREFRPWIDPEVPLAAPILTELYRRARAEGAEEADNGWDADNFEDDLRG